MEPVLGEYVLKVSIVTFVMSLVVFFYKLIFKSISGIFTWIILLSAYVCGLAQVFNAFWITRFAFLITIITVALKAFSVIFFKGGGTTEDDNSDSKTISKKRTAKSVIGGIIGILVLVGCVYYIGILGHTELLGKMPDTAKTEEKAPAQVEDKEDKKKSDSETLKLHEEKSLPQTKFNNVSDNIFGFSFDYPENLKQPVFNNESGYSAIYEDLELGKGQVGVDFSYKGEGLENYIKRKYSNLYNNQNYQIISDDTAILNYPNGFIAKIIVKNKPVINDRGDAISSGRQYYMKFTINGNINDPANSDIKHVLDSFTVE